MNTSKQDLFVLTAALSLIAASGVQAAPPEPPVLYVVKPGDTLIGLASVYLNRPGDYLQVQRANQIARPRALRIGSTLRIDPNLLKSTPIDARL
ncbi:MAG: LysM peptidoglycan-binding domain-containing protein, partial [Alphaproteobacteria bacterium]|nr:LysM peptidoglycan-binding domain-containing protein [Alphaproteobacteria bacterium]